MTVEEEIVAKSKRSSGVKLMESALTTTGAVVVFMLIITGLSLLFAFPVKWLVNWVFAPKAIQAMFGVPVLSVWRAWGLYLVFGILFSNKGAGK